MTSPTDRLDAFVSAERHIAGPHTRQHDGIRERLQLACALVRVRSTEDGAHLPLTPTSVTHATVLLPMTRQVPRRLWQPDSETDECSMLSCAKKFDFWEGERRHHCRQCGRVVCGACSTRKKMMLPPKGDRGPPKSVRVCEACFLSHETFSFPRSSSGRSLGSDSGDGGLVRGMPSPSSPVRKIGKLRVSLSSPAILSGTSDSVITPTDKLADRVQEMLAPDQDALAVASSSPASGADTQPPGSPNSDSKSVRCTTSPVRINRGDAHRSEADVLEETECETAAEQLLGDVAPADERRREWIANVQKKFGADPHYHAMLKYEPQALKALITCTMGPNMAAN